MRPRGNVRDWCGAGGLTLLLVMAGCTGLNPRWFESSLPAPHPDVVILVAPIVVDAPITHASDIYTFDDPLPEDIEPHVRRQLIDEVAVRAQRVLTERLSEERGFRVIPFMDARRLPMTPIPAAQRWTDAQLEELGRSAGAELVVAARINDYGRLQWDHWVVGWLGVATTHTAIVGAATGWNPLAMGAYLGYDLATDLPLWYGGAYMLGWAFRPVHVEIFALQVKECVQPVWHDKEVTIIAGRNDLAAYPEGQRRRKDVQLQVNLDQALARLAKAAGKTLRMRSCAPDPRNSHSLPQ
jgi:hypothetical protein